MTEPAPLRPPPGRYGPERAARPRWVAVVLGLALVAAIVVAGWLGLRTGAVPVDGQDIGFRVADEAVEVTFDVVRPDPARAASCRVEALNASHAQVGVVTVEVPPSADVRVRMTTTVRTSERAVTGTVTQCRIAD